MIIVKIQRIQFKGNTAILPHDYVIAAKDWLSQWTLDNNCKLILAEDEEQGLELAKAEFVNLFKGVSDNCLLGYKPEHFEFCIGTEEVRDNKFWTPRSTIMKWHSVT